MILTDDVGYDDLGFHNPRVNTPNIDKFRQRSTVFENFYTSPQCAQTRAQFLTGRSFARTGTLRVGGGWDFIHRGEVTIGEAMAAGGYRTAHFGKWHNMQVLGYEPWHNGFEEGYIPPFEGSDGEGLARLNGLYLPAREEGHMYDKSLRNLTIEYLRQRVEDGQPFFVFFATRSIHTNFLLPDPVTGVPTQRRVVPAEYRDKFDGPKYDDVALSTKDAWAFMEYLDDSLAPLFNFLASSGLDQSTYVMMTGDNGPAVYSDERPARKKLIRMPSRMSGEKHSIFEGGIRNCLIVQGPGVKAGATDSTMIAISDIFPTMVDIAGAGATVPQGLPLDGISFKSVLLPSSDNETKGSRPATGGPAAGAGSALQQQNSLAWRYFFMLGPDCWGPDAVPELGPDRIVVKPQKMLDYRLGGKGAGFKSCIVVRYRDYKWFGKSGKVYQFVNETQHLENAQHEVAGAKGAGLARKMSKAAQQWWQSVTKEPWSFHKPTFYLGFRTWMVTNMIAAGAHQRTPANIRLLVDGAKGFQVAGDSMCFKLQVLTAGTYSATAMYTSNIQATFRLSVGPYADIKAGSAQSLTVQWPAQDVMRGMLLGSFMLPASSGQTTEACLELLSSLTLNGKTAVFKHLANIQWIRIPSTRLQGPQTSGGVNTNKDANDQGNSEDSSTDLEKLVLSSSSSSSSSSISSSTAQSVDTDLWPVAVPAPGLDLAGEYSWLRNAASRAAQLVSVKDEWTALRLKNGWPDGQSVLESMFSPYDTEGIDECLAEDRDACRPPV